MSLQLPETIRQWFKVTDKGKVWHLHCKKCRAGWALNKPDGDTWRDASVLHLLNHAYSHDPKIRREAEDDDE